jgi:outer membrane receptor protein involved in Fe transport
MDGRNEIISVRLDDGSTENRNAGRTRHKGIEYAFVYTPIRSLSFRLGGTNALHEFLRYEESGVVFDGNEMNQAPGWIVNAEVTYKPGFLEGSRIALEWQHLDDYYMDVANTYTYSGYDLLHLRLGYEIKGVEVWANIENLTDELYANIASRGRFGDSYSPGVARNVVFGLGYRFGR